MIRLLVCYEADCKGTPIFGHVFADVPELSEAALTKVAVDLGTVLGQHNPITGTVAFRSVTVLDRAQRQPPVIEISGCSATGESTVSASEPVILKLFRSSYPGFIAGVNVTIERKKMPEPQKPDAPKAKDGFACGYDIALAGNHLRVPHGTVCQFPSGESWRFDSVKGWLLIRPASDR